MTTATEQPAMPCSEVERHRKILERLDQQQRITVTDLVEQFEISPATARRDLVKLSDKGLLHRVRNGAEPFRLAALSARKSMLWSPMNIHQTEHLDEKSRIARAAANLCIAGDSVIINCGSTAFLLGQELCGQPLQIITNYYPLANHLIEQEHDGVVIMGGEYHRAQGITISTAENTAALYAGDIMFTSGAGLTAEGLYKTDLLMAMAEQKMLNQAERLVVLVDSSKLGKKAGMMFCSLGQINTVITGNSADPHMVHYLREQNIEVLLV